MTNSHLTKHPSVTVLIPCYNGKKWIDRCFEALRKQGINDFEIVVVDDKSTDDSLKILNKWTKVFPQLKIVKNKKNVGLAHVRNILISNVKTEYFVFVDIDDKLPKNTLSNLLKPVVEDKIKYDLVAGKVLCCMFDKKLKPRITISLPITNNYSKECYSSRKWLIKNYSLSVWGKLIRKEYWNSLNYEFLNGKIFEDFYISFFLVFEAKKFCAITKPTYVYSRHPNTLSSYDKFSQKKFNDFRYQVNIFMKAIEHDKRFKNPEYKKCLSSWFSAVSTVFWQWYKLCKNDKNHLLAFNKFRNDFIYKFMYKAGQSVNSPKNWWNITTNTYFNRVFGKEIRYWKKQIKNKKK